MITNVYRHIISMDNLRIADIKAQKGKSSLPAVQRYNANREENLDKLHTMLRDKTYKNSPYTLFDIYEPKKRTIARLPFFPDRIVQHAIMNVMEKRWYNLFSKHTFCCIKNRGIKGCVDYVRSFMHDKIATRYCLKIDIRHYYQSIDHDILKSIIRKDISDENLLWLLDEIIDSYEEGIPIGNYVSQFFANLYLTDFDKWITKTLNVRTYVRYADDMVFFSSEKESLHILLEKIKERLAILKLTLKGNEQIFPVADNRYDKSGRGVDFCGVVFYHEQTLMRKEIKKNFARKAAVMNDCNDERLYKRALSSWYGWSLMCNAVNLRKKLNIKYFGIC